MLCRSGRYVLMTICLWSVSVFATDPPLANHWSSKEKRTSMDDGSTLTEYIASTPATNSGGIWLETVFIPRFACSPLTAIKVAEDHLWTHHFGDDTSFALEFTIDEETHLLAVNLDKVMNEVELIFQGDMQRRLTLQQQIDKGLTGTINIDQYLQITFSLLGSSEIHKLAKQNCLKHEATPIKDAESLQAKQQ